LAIHSWNAIQGHSQDESHESRRYCVGTDRGWLGTAGTGVGGA
jgi:hypothetical protein